MTLRARDWDMRKAYEILDLRAGLIFGAEFRIAARCFSGRRPEAVKARDAVERSPRRFSEQECGLKDGRVDFGVVKMAKGDGNPAFLQNATHFDTETQTTHRSVLGCHTCGLSAHNWEYEQGHFNALGCRGLHWSGKAATVPQKNFKNLLHAKSSVV